MKKLKIFLCIVLILILGKYNVEHLKELSRLNGLFTVNQIMLVVTERIKLILNLIIITLLIISSFRLIKNSEKKVKKHIIASIILLIIYIVFCLVCHADKPVIIG